MLSSRGKDAARFAMSSSSGDAITMQDMSHVFDSGRERGLLERLFTPAAINKAGIRADLKLFERGSSGILDFRMSFQWFFTVFELFLRL